MPAVDAGTSQDAGTIEVPPAQSRSSAQSRTLADPTVQDAGAVDGGMSARRTPWPSPNGAGRRCDATGGLDAGWVATLLIAGGLPRRSAGRRAESPDPTASNRTYLQIFPLCASLDVTEVALGLKGDSDKETSSVAMPCSPSSRCSPSLLLPRRSRARPLRRHPRLARSPRSDGLPPGREEAARRRQDRGGTRRHRDGALSSHESELSAAQRAGPRRMPGKPSSRPPAVMTRRRMLPRKLPNRASTTGGSSSASRPARRKSSAPCRTYREAQQAKHVEHRERHEREFREETSSEADARSSWRAGPSGVPLFGRVDVHVCTN